LFANHHGKVLGSATLVGSLLLLLLLLGGLGTATALWLLLLAAHCPSGGVF
jgi:hypothetical protein